MKKKNEPYKQRLNVNQEEMKSEKNGSATSLKHFIYLDRNRLNSYSSQLEDGIIQLRRLTENLGNKTADVHGEKYTEKTEEEARDIELSLGPKNIMGGGISERK